MILELSLLWAAVLPAPAAARLSIDIYYESLCPDSTRFISQQIPPVWNALQSEIEINFNPYGLAETTVAEDGSYEFECQHGERECYGNIVQACTVAHTPDAATRTTLIVCMMSASAPDQAGPDCFAQAGIDFEPIQTCIESGEGAALHAQYGETQNAQDPRPNNVPWINLDQAHLAEYWELEEFGFLQFICDTFPLTGCSEN